MDHVTIFDDLLQIGVQTDTGYGRGDGLGAQ